MSGELKGIFSCLPRTTRGIPMVLGKDPKGKNFLYTNGQSVIIRNISTPSESDVYTEHATTVNVAQYSPSGFYIASGDAHGKVRIWDTVNKEHILKNEFQPLGGSIKDLAWSGDNQRICTVGEGREKCGHVFSADTGTSTGEIMGQSKPLNAVDIRAERPFRLVTASEDTTLAFFHGPPFKFQFTLKDHTRFVNCVRYAPNGDTFTSGSADGKAIVYDGKTGEKKLELGAPAHGGGIYGVSYSPDSKQVLTASGDKSCKVWDVDSGTMVTLFTLGTAVEDMQVGCLWQDANMLSVSLSGHINYLDKNNPTCPLRILKGHNKPITAFTLSDDKGTMFTGDSTGKLCHWNSNSGDCDIVNGKAHSNQIQCMAISDGTLFTAGLDDTLTCTDTGSKKVGESVKLPSQPKGLGTGKGGLAVVACVNDVVVARGGRIVYSQKADFEPSSASVHPGQTEVAVGGGDNKTRIYKLNGDTLQDSGKVLEHSGSVMNLAYSPDGSYLATCDANRKVMLFTLPDYTAKIKNEWSGHTAKVSCISWSPDSQHLVTGSLDTNIIVWNPEKKMNYITIKGAHPMSQVTGIGWLDDNTVVTTGHDSSIRKWAITHN